MWQSEASEQEAVVSEEAGDADEDQILRTLDFNPKHCKILSSEEMCVHRGGGVGGGGMDLQRYQKCRP